MFTVPLSKLYTVIASCQFTEDSLYCPVLVRINDEKTLRQNRDRAYLLQVWSKRGELLFERSLEHQISNWNISGNNLLF